MGTQRWPSLVSALPVVFHPSGLQDGAADDVRRIEVVAGQGSRHHQDLRDQRVG